MNGEALYNWTHYYGDDLLELITLGNAVIIEMSEEIDALRMAKDAAQEEARELREDMEDVINELRERIIAQPFYGSVKEMVDKAIQDMAVGDEQD